MKRLLTIACAGMMAVGMAIPAFGQAEPPKPQPPTATPAPAAGPDAERARAEVDKIKEQLKLAKDQAEKARVLQDQARAEQEKAQLDLQIQQLQQRDAAAQYRRALTGVRAGGPAGGGAANEATYQRFMAATAARQAVATKKEKMAYVGVSTVEPPLVLTEQLKLTKGMGLVVDFVEPSSPAEAAGIKQYDVITKFDDQLVINQEQFRALVWMKNQSDDVKLSLIRQGRRICGAFTQCPSDCE